MLRKINFIVLLLCAFISYSQESTFSIPIEMKGNRDVFQIINQSNNTVTLFLSDKENVTAIRLNEKFEVVDSLSTNRPDKKYAEILGYNGDYNNPRIIWGKQNKKEILEQEFNFLNGTSKTKDYSLELKKEKVIKAISTNSIFYLITCSKDDLSLNFYVLKDYNLELKKIDLKEIAFYNSYKERTNIFDVFTESINMENANSGVELVSKNTLTTLLSSSIKRKMYVDENNITFTFDNSKNVTQTIFIDLTTFNHTIKFYQNPNIIGEDMFLNSNSYLYDNKVFQIKTSSEEFYLTVKDLDDKLIKTHHLKKNDSLYFNNTPVYQENGEFGGNREFDKASKFIRKINNLSCGLTVHNLHDNYLITIGSVSQSNGNAVMMGSMFGLAGALVATAINPTVDSFNSYANQKVVFTNCLFNKEIEHVNGSVPELPFDKIRKYLDTIKGLKSKTLFKFNDYYYLGFYLRNEGKYSFEKFKETIR